MNDIQAHRCDVLIIGGGMAAAWAAIAAAKTGAITIMVDKSYVGTSGVTATGGPNHWWVPPDPGKRREVIERKLAAGLGLGDPEWMERVIDTTWRTLPELAPYYPFGSDGKGGRYYSGVRGAEYMRALRAYALAAGARILDHHPATQLLVNGDGAVRGARGHARLIGRDWEIQAGAVIMATGGCAFRSGLLGSHGNTGDGYLMAVEAGAELSGMEFSIQYSVSPAWASTRTLPYGAARYYDVDGEEIVQPPRGHAHFQALGAALLTGPVYADLIDAPSALPPVLHDIQPFTPPPFVRKGVDLFKERWPIKLFGEGTIRGNGGLRIRDGNCRTNVPGLFAAGDAATRELATGAISGGGAVNSAWALTSGQIAGAAAAKEALAGRRRTMERLRSAASAAIHPVAAERPVDRKAIEADIDHHMNGYQHALWRSERQLTDSLKVLDAHWRAIRDHGRAEGLSLVSLRETAAMTATARWCTAAALSRRESRGIHVRIDAPELDAGSGARLLTGGLDMIWTRPEQQRYAEAAA
ncbi:succinate dehydrogenase/fumarate reductase flavoprotein subunit [Sphingobium sp. LB126]|uniref:FAD-dependent oxidoreductase n=1 Tax=Sphingobium sp. LB126 TaxID=1983755 RepID=UPI000C200249|nr:FAD-binding protein [Sphingobium sp. LB126]PJG46517.1 succinate dehydrogenase/fumarate reductase flavoprotein subunit [Sphingobium sp. LB126]